MSENKMTTLYLPKDMIKDLKKLAADEEVSMAEIVRQILTHSLHSSTSLTEDRDEQENTIT